MLKYVNKNCYVNVIHFDLHTWKHFDVVLWEVSIWPVVFQIRALTTFLFLQIVSQLLEKWPHPPCTPSKPEKRKRRKYFALYNIDEFFKKNVKKDGHS